MSLARKSLFLPCYYCLRNLPKHSFVEHNFRGVCQLLCFTSQVISVCSVTGIVASDLAAEHNGLTVRDRRGAASRYTKLACTPNCERVLITCVTYN
jgi:hypothetical protein